MFSGQSVAYPDAEHAMADFIRFAVLQGPLAHMAHLFSKERIPFTCAYFSSLALTLFFAIGVRADSSDSYITHRRLCLIQRRAYLPTLLCALVQLVALIAYFVAYFP